jgi:hypothetical protein
MLPRLHHLRFAPAVAFALLALAFVGLWVRSYWWLDSFQVRIDAQKVAAFGSVKGASYFSTFVSNVEPKRLNLLSSRYGKSGMLKDFESSPYNLAIFRVERWWPDSVAVVWPQWVSVAFFALLAVLFAFKPITRFTIRGLLITTAQLAAILGLIVYAV